MRSLSAAVGALALVLALAVPGAAAPLSSAATGGPGSNLKHDLGETRLALVVRLALLEHFKTDALHIGISVTGTKVTLTGRVHHHSTQELAAEVARSVKGVSDVDDELELVPAESSPSSAVKREMAKAGREIDDAALESRVKLRLIDSIGLKAFDVEVEASNAVVSLRGTLPDNDFRHIALRVARDTTGVKRVIDLIRVR
jgi:hyperosmotically inducible protein